MHIKQITISNFRSFRQQPEIHPFAATTNCVVGRNGSGKSNLFDAIQFVLLSPRFATLRTEERQALLHEGSGSAAVNAFVEVVFDNSDNRFSLENSDEVVLRRTVGAKKDEFFLQRKRATKQEVQSLLEGAGFSKSNPYFMVQQGKIQTLCLMTDAQRLALLQEVAGTTVYEDKKAESLVKMTENAQSIEKINEILEDIDTRLTELKGEKEELTVYQECDRKRKALEYTLYDKELRKARHVLDHIEHERSKHLEATAGLHEMARQTHDQIQNAEAQLKIKSQALKRNRVQLQNLEEDKTRTVTLRTQLDLQCQELQEQVQMGEETLVRTQAELKELETKITQAQEDLIARDKALKEGQAALQQLLQEKDQATRQADAIYAKQGRGKEYSSKEDRDRSLRKQIKKLQDLQKEKRDYLASQQESLGNLRRSTQDYERDIESKKEELRRKTESLQGLHKTLEEKTKNHYSMIDVRKDSWRQAESLQDRAKEARETYHQAVGVFRKSMPRATSMGIRALPRIVEQEGLVHGQQYFGMVMENMELKDPKYQTAVEAATQNALFHVIVDTDDTAARLMNRLEKERLGRVTFMPLNQIRVDNNTRYPQSNDVVSLLDRCVDYDPKVAKAMQHVFHRKLLARNAELASEWAEKAQMDCITLDGDICSRKGALTGGYVDLQKSRLRAHAAKKEAEAAFRSLDQEFRAADAKAKQAEQDVTNASQEVSRLQNKQSQLSRMVGSVETEVSEREAQLISSKRQAERIESQVIPPIEREIATISGDIGRLEEEIGTELVSSLSNEDRNTLDLIKDQSKALQDKISEQSEKVEDLIGDRRRVESLLEDNLLKRRQELTQVYREDDSGLVATSSTMLQDQRKRELEDRRQDLAQAIQDVESVDRKLAECRTVEEQIKGELRAAKQELDKLKGQDMKNSESLDKASEQSEKLMSKKSMNITKRDSYMRKIQELGSLPPPSELKNYQNQSISDLEKELERVNKKLKKYSHVNKKAFDQYVNFSEQRESLLKRKDELDKGAEKVKELVESLDRKKDEAINRTFRGVSKHFSEVFKELVPLGAGELIMRTALDDGNGDETDKEMESDGEGSPEKQKAKSLNPENPDVSLYRGIGIKVRFSAVGENFLMSQLSGGQKALVALALIFAIQRCDPAPFYIFDELDQALDSTYRQAVANLIQKQANNPDSPTQFITSTFRPELVAIARNCYGISHQNKVSSIHHMSRNDALKFIANLMSEEEAVGEITTIKSKGSKRDSRKRKSSEALEEDTTARTSLPATSEEGAAEDSEMAT
mmetsp:Transcript_48506/g.139469  ORF Transcript_48506/g.139469 Transcript_48506/m.139469 type:complete len:1291 (-) Transcript_48506:77-3949(-)